MIRSHPHLILSGLWGQEVCSEGHNQAEQSHGTQVPSRSSATVSHHSPQCQDQGGVFWFLIFKAVAKYKLGALGTDPCCTRPLQWLLGRRRSPQPCSPHLHPKKQPFLPQHAAEPSSNSGGRRRRGVISYKRRGAGLLPSTGPTLFTP